MDIHNIAINKWVKRKATMNNRDLRYFKEMLIYLNSKTGLSFKHRRVTTIEATSMEISSAKMADSNQQKKRWRRAPTKYIKFGFTTS